MPFQRKYGTLLVTGTTSIRIPIIKRAVVDFSLGADWTPAAGDVKVFVDAAAVANITNLPTAIASGNGAFWEFILTAAELTCKQLLVVVSDAATKAVEDQSFIVETYGNASAMYVTDFSAQLATPTNITAGTITTATNLTTNNDKTGYGLSAAAVQAIWDALTTALTTAGSIGKKLADWVIGTTQTGDSFARLGAPAGASVSVDIAAVKADTAAIKTKTDSLTFTVAGKVDANSLSINGIATAAARLARSTQGIVTGTVGAASTTTSIVTSALDPAAAVIDQFKGRIVTFDQGTITANLRGQSTDITANTALGVLTVTALTTAAVSGDTFVIT